MEGSRSRTTARRSAALPYEVTIPLFVAGLDAWRDRDYFCSKGPYEAIEVCPIAAK